MAKVIKKYCFRCGLFINPKDNHATLDSFSNNKVVHSDSWHAKCWSAHWEEKMDLKCQEYAQKILSKSLPKVKEVLNYTENVN